MGCKNSAFDRRIRRSVPILADPDYTQAKRFKSVSQICFVRPLLPRPGGESADDRKPKPWNFRLNLGRRGRRRWRKRSWVDGFLGDMVLYRPLPPSLSALDTFRPSP